MAEPPQIQVGAYPAQYISQFAGSGPAVQYRAITGQTSNLIEHYGTDGTLVNAVGPLGQGSWRRKILSATTLGGSAATLTTAQSGSICLNDVVGGYTWTLPLAQVGVEFEFQTLSTVTGTSYKVITGAGTELLVGMLLNVDTDTGSAVAIWQSLAATSNIAVTMAAAGTNATGGIAGSSITFTCMSATRWLVKGMILSAGTVATPFATS